MNVVSKKSPLKHYGWGNNCDGWNLVDAPGLSVKVEKMPPHTSEQKHVHQFAQQFFYILNGAAVFEIEGERIYVKAEQGIHIAAGKSHRIINEGSEDLEFILTSQPSTANDRTNIE